MAQKAITVTQLNEYLKNLFAADRNLQNVCVSGEISNFKRHSSGHLYFTLKDEESVISAVMFRGDAMKLRFRPESGMKVLLLGRVSLYPKSGQYQIYVSAMQPDGIGSLYMAFEQLKERLYKMGLFDPAAKQALPRYPKKIALITSPTGAAVRDMIRVLRHRYPICDVLVCPVKVQGEGAAEEVAAMIDYVNEHDLADLIITGRGGGSLEDLWAFNEEIVAHAIYESEIPIISAVGHEPDFTIADYVADLRAPTPTGAAEMAVPTIMEINNMLNQYTIRLNKHIKNTVNNSFIKLRSLKNNYVLKNPLALYETKEQKLDNYIDILNKVIDNNLKDKKHQYSIIINTLKLVNPLGLLEKGYSLVKKNGQLINDVSDLKENDLIDVKLYKGNLKAEIREVNNE